MLSKACYTNVTSPQGTTRALGEPGRDNLIEGGLMRKGALHPGDGIVSRDEARGGEPARSLAAGNGGH